MTRPDWPFALLAVALLSACGSGGSDGGNPPGGDGNDSFAAAQAVVIGSPSTGTISSATDEDWFKFTTTGAGDVTVALTGLSADADLALYDSSQVQLSASSSTGTTSETVTWTAGAADTFRVVVLPGATAANYTLTVSFTPAVVSDGNDTFATAQAVALGSSTSGFIASPTDDDWYKFTTTGAGEITVALTGLTADADLGLYDAAQVSLAGSANVGTASETVTATTGGAGTYYVRVIPHAATTGYALAVSFTPAAGGDGNDTFLTAQTVAIGSTTAGAIASISDPDWYRFTTTGAGTVTVTIGALTADANLALYDAAETLLAGSSNLGTASDTVSHVAVAAGTFYVQVIPQGGAAAYSLTVAFTPTVVTDGNDTYDTAQAIALNNAIIGTIASVTDPDWYRVTTASPGTITVTLSGLTSDADLELYGIDPLSPIRGSYVAGTANDTVTYTAAIATTYRVLVRPGGSSTPYTLTTAFTP
jgi:hypothetical protein